MKLFIIGNGFDLYHGLPTKYSDFMNYLKNMYPNVYQNFYHCIKKYSLMYKNKRYSMDHVLLWSDLEYLFGDLELREMISEYEQSNVAVIYDGLPNQEIVDQLELGQHIKEYLYAWLTSIDIEIMKIKPIPWLKREINNSENIFLSFNYTKTLEILYGIKNVIHIHGIKTDKNSLVMGHDERPSIKSQGADNVNKEFVRKYEASTYKNTYKYIQEYKEILFNKQILSKVKEIHIMGHSLNQVDMPYFFEIQSLTHNNCKWVVYCLDNHETSKIKNRIEKIGVYKKNIEIKLWVK